MITIFLDTNIIIKTYLKRLENNRYLNHSLLLDYGPYFNFIISEYIVGESHEVIQRLLGDDYDPFTLKEFIHYLNIEVKESQIHKTVYDSYVNDIDDSQIVQDAHHYKAILLISQNEKDFFMEKIKQELHIEVTNIQGLVTYIRFFSE